MKKVTGALKRLGQASLGPTYNVYSMIEIGDQILSNVKIPNKLDGILNEGLRTKSPTTLSLMAGKIIMAVQIEGQDRYIAKFNWGVWSFAFLVMLISVFSLYSLSKNWMVGVAGLVVLYWVIARPTIDYLKIASEGGKKF